MALIETVIFVAGQGSVWIRTQKKSQIFNALISIWCSVANVNEWKLTFVQCCVCVCMCSKKTPKSDGNNKSNKKSITLERLILMLPMKHVHCSRQSRIQMYTQLRLPACLFVFHAQHWIASVRFFSLSLMLCAGKTNSPTHTHTHTAKRLKDFTSHLYVMVSGCTNILTEIENDTR